MRKFKRSNDFKSERPFHKEFKSDRPAHKEFEMSPPRFRERSPARRFGRDEDRSHRSSRAPLELFDVTCAKCGKACQVPFKPMTSKPVYCRDCFKKNDGPEERRFEPRSDRQDNRSDSELQQINRKLDKIMEALDIN